MFCSPIIHTKKFECLCLGKLGLGSQAPFQIVPATPLGGNFNGFAGGWREPHHC